MSFSTQIKAIKASKIGKYVLSASSQNSEDEIVIDASHIDKVIEFLSSSAKFQLHILLDICGADLPKEEKRFEVVYHLLSLTENKRLRIRAKAADGEVVPSVTFIFNSAAWYEREIWDMYGVKFSGNPDLRRILTDYGFEGHPLRKDFPLTGYKEVRYDYSTQKVVYEDVYLTQEYRDFDTLSPWEGANYKLPGDEKATK